MAVIAVLSAWLVVRVFRPLLDPVLFAAALALFTGPVLSSPIDEWIRSRRPEMAVRLRRRITGILATLIVLTVLVVPVLLLLLAAAGSVAGLAGTALGVLTNDPVAMMEVRELIDAQLLELERLYPALPLQRAGITDRIVELIAEARGFGPEFIGFLFHGSSQVAQLVLALISLAFFIAEGPWIAREVLRHSPLEPDQQEQLVQRHGLMVKRLLLDTAGTALVKGCALGFIAWSVDAVLGSGRFSFLLISVLGAVISLLPVVGVAVVWLPLATILWTSGHIVAAIVLALLSIAANILIDMARGRLVRRIDERGALRSFALFLSLIGGVLTFGLEGLVIGPMAVVLLFSIASFWLPVYGIGRPPVVGPAGAVVSADDDTV